jgi:Carboxypeptidase regulatory-like domain
MRIMARQGLAASAVALLLGMALHGVASAQGDGSSPDAGLVTGEVARCVNGAEEPAAQVAVGVEGGSASLTRSDSNGQFFLSLPPGQYTITATASDGTASRQYVPVEAGQALDIGNLDIGGGAAGCGPDSDITAPVLPTFTSTPAPTAEPPTPTGTPTALPAATPTPAPDDTTDPGSAG